MKIILIASKILVLGAGPSGMACALELSKAGKKFLVVEKAGSVGGLAKTCLFGEFLTDIGPHRFYTKNQYLESMMKNLLGEKWIQVKRHTRFYIHGKYYQYPLDPASALFTLGIVQSIKIARDYFWQKLFHFSAPKNFEEYAISKFGRLLAELNILNYTEKIWGVHPNRMSVDWANQRIKGLSMFSTLKNFFFKSGSPKSMVNYFHYPESGTGFIYEKMSEIIGKDKILLNVEPLEIKITGNKITWVLLSNGKKLSVEKMVSSIPITVFCKNLVPAPPKEVLEASKKLRFRSQVYLFITLNKPSVTDDQWIYFPDKEIPFGRISEMKNFSKKMSPKDKTSLFVEFFCWKNDSVWKMSKGELLNKTIKWLEKLGFVEQSEIIDSYLLRSEFGYPVYELGYEKNLAVVKKYLDSIENLLYIGRPGRFKYTNQDHSIEMGINAGRGIIENKKTDIEQIGKENEYFEMKSQ